MPKHIAEKIKAEVRKRAKGYCEYCYASTSFSPIGFDIDHILPVSLGGISELKNLALAVERVMGINIIKLIFLIPSPY